MAHVFISYSRVDSEFAERLVDRLRRIYGLPNVWYDDELHGGAHWWAEILRQIAACDIFIYLLSNESVTSPYCQAEFAEAQRLQKPVVTVQVRDRTRLSDELSAIQYIDMKHGINDETLARLIGSISKMLEQPKKKRALWKPATPLPDVPASEDASVPVRPDIDTPTLELRALPKSSADDRSLARATIIGALITGLLGIVGVFIAVILPMLLDSSNTPTPDPIPTTAVAAARNPTDEPTDTPPPTSTETPAPTDTSPPTETPVPTDTPQPTDTEIPTLSAFGALQTVQAELTQAAETQVAFYLTATEQAITDGTATAVAVLIGATETAAHATLLALSATPTVTPTNTRRPTIIPWPTIPLAALPTMLTLSIPTTSPEQTTPTPTPTSTPNPNSTPTLSPEEIARTPVARNADWTPVEREFEMPRGGTVTMVLVPAGCFDMGSDNGHSNEQPIHEICFDEPFWIDKYEVTNEDYGSVGCAQWSSEPDQPRNCVTWFEASSFCEIRAARLPTEAEWEYAARGPDNLVYPWGNTYDAALVIGRDDPTYGNTNTAPVGSRPSGASWVGALDMSGNVWEWVSSLYLDYPYADDRESNNNDNVARVLRSGSFGSTAYGLRAANRIRNLPDFGNINFGFRCARSFDAP